jgi:hypothetical protein
VKFRKKPVVIEAKQVQLLCSDGSVEFTDGSTEQFGIDHEGTFIQTLEGKLRISEYDWIITGVKGERYPCKPDIFEATYDAADAPTPVSEDVLNALRAGKRGLDLLHEMRQQILTQTKFTMEVDQLVEEFNKAYPWPTAPSEAKPNR